MAHRLEATDTKLVLQYKASLRDPAGHPPAGFLFRPYPGRLCGAMDLVLAVDSSGMLGLTDLPSVLPPAVHCAAQAQLMRLWSG